MFPVLQMPTPQLKYFNAPSPQNMVLDPTNTIVVGLEISVILMAHGETVRKDALYTLPEADRFTIGDARDMELFADKVVQAQMTTGLLAQAEAAMDELLAAKGLEVVS